jgi:hypothetical protein
MESLVVATAADSGRFQQLRQMQAAMRVEASKASAAMTKLEVAQAEQQRHAAGARTDAALRRDLHQRMQRLERQRDAIAALASELRCGRPACFQPPGIWTDS